MNRLAPRHGFVLGGLLLVAAAAWSDRHLFAFTAHVVEQVGPWDEPDLLTLASQPLDEQVLEARMRPGPQAAAALRVRAALDALEIAERAFATSLVQALQREPALVAESDPAEGTWEAILAALDRDGWEPYLRAREAALPAYRAAVQAFAREAQEASAADPGNGAYDLLAHLAQLDLCYQPSPADPLLGWDLDEDVSAARIRITDPEGFQRHVEAVESALAAERLTFHTRAIQRARLEACDRPGPAGQLERLDAVATVMMPELMFLKGRAGNGLTLLARRERLQGRSGDRFLRAARRLAIRQGAEGESLITVLVGLANASLADQAWLLEAAARGDTTRAMATKDELETLQRARADSMRQDLPRERLGLVDWALLPAGGWASGWSPRLGLATDFAYVESAALWTLILLTLTLLVRSAVLSRRSAAAAPVAPWTFGDLLSVVLPSLGAATALILCTYRLHPLTQVGAGAGDVESRLFPLGFLGFAGIFSCAWLLRRRVLSKAGLDFVRPRAARGSLLLALLATELAVDWIGPWSMSLAPLAGVLALAALALAWRGGVWGGAGFPAPSRAALAGYEGRVGLACLGAGLILIGAVQLTASARRERLTRALADQHVGLMLQEERQWGAGRLQDAFRVLAVEAPHQPTSWLERQR